MGLYVLVDWIFTAMEGLILAHVVLSWLYSLQKRPAWLRSPVVRWLDRAGDRLLRPFRRLLDRLGITRVTQPLDLSPLLAILVLRWVHSLLLAPFP